MVEWTLQISTKDNKNQEQVNSYALVAKFPELEVEIEEELYEDSLD
jgi:hypothetical protein